MILFKIINFKNIMSTYNIYKFINYKHIYIYIYIYELCEAWVNNVDLVAIINQLPINCVLGHDIWLTLSLVIYFGKNWPLPFLKKQFSILPSFPN